MLLRNVAVTMALCLCASPLPAPVDPTPSVGTTGDEQVLCVALGCSWGPVPCGIDPIPVLKLFFHRSRSKHAWVPAPSRIGGLSVATDSLTRAKTPTYLPIPSRAAKRKKMKRGGLLQGPFGRNKTNLPIWEGPAKLDPLSAT